MVILSAIDLKDFNRTATLNEINKLAGGIAG